MRWNFLQKNDFGINERMKENVRLEFDMPLLQKNKYDNLPTLLLRSANTFVDYADDKIKLNISNFEESLNTSTY